MGIGNFLSRIGAARDQLDSQVYAVVYALEKEHDWSQHRAYEFCMKDKGNKKRILHMSNMLRQSAGQIANQIHAGAVSSGYNIR
jgi:hypothetical protein